MSITVYDVVLLIVIGFGIYEGRKKGFYKMVTPFISFAVSIFLMRWVGGFIMNIFGDSLIDFFSGQLDQLISQMALTENVAIEDIKYDFVQKFVQGGVFVVSYIAINVVVTIILNKIRRLSNNMIIYRIDQLLGCVFGGLSNIFTVVLILTVVQILCDMNVAEIINIVNNLRKSTFISWLLDNNFIYKIFVSL